MRNAIGFALSDTTREQYIQFSMARMAIRNVERNLGNEFYHVNEVARDWVQTLSQLTQIPSLQPSYLKSTLDESVGSESLLHQAHERLVQATTLLFDQFPEPLRSGQKGATEGEYERNVSLCMRALRLVSCARHLVRSWQQAVVARFVWDWPTNEASWSPTWGDTERDRWEGERVKQRDLFATRHGNETWFRPDEDAKRAAVKCYWNVRDLLDQCRALVNRRSGNDVDRCTFSRSLSHELNLLRTVYSWRYDPQLQEQAIQVQMELLELMRSGTVFHNSIRLRVRDIIRYRLDAYHFYSAIDPMIGGADRPRRYPSVGLNHESEVRGRDDAPTCFRPEVSVATVGNDGRTESGLTTITDRLTAGRVDTANEPRLSANIVLAQYLMETIDKRRKASDFLLIYEDRDEYLVTFKRRIEAFASCDLGMNDRTPEEVFADAYRVYCLLNEVAVPLQYVGFKPGALLSKDKAGQPDPQVAQTYWTTPVTNNKFSPGELEALFLGMFVRVLGRPQKDAHADELGHLAGTDKTPGRVEVSATKDNFTLLCRFTRRRGDEDGFVAFYDALLAHAAYIDDTFESWQKADAPPPLKLTFGPRVGPVAR